MSGLTGFCDSHILYVLVKKSKSAHKPPRFGPLIAAAVLATLAMPAPAVASAGAFPRGFTPGFPSPDHLRPEFTLCGAHAHGGAPDLFAAFSLSVPRDEPAPSPGPVTAPAARMKKKWGRAFLELGALLGYSTVRYWLAYGEFIEDWQYELTCEDQYRRFFTTEALRFDSNCFSLNWTHALAGGLYYQTARANHLTAFESFLVTTGGSLFYEYIGEWREVISVNDMIITSVGGYPLGEAWYQLGKYFHHQKSFFPRVLGFLNPFVEFHQWLDRKDPASKVYDQPGWHGMEIWAGWRRQTVTGRETVDSAAVGFDMQLIHVPEYGKPGAFRRALRDTVFSEMSLDMVLRQRLPSDVEARTGLDEDVHFFTRVVGWASYRQEIDELSRGYAVSFGLGSAFTYIRRRPVTYDAQSIRVGIDPPPVDPVDFRDKVTAVHIIGPVLDWTSFGRGWKLRSVTEAYLDFAMAGSTAINEYSRLRTIQGLKTTLNYYGYHYALGASFSTRVDLDWRGFRIRGLVSGHIWDSVEGIDRFQADIEDDGNAVDTRVRYLLKASWKMPGAPLRFFAGHEGLRRWGRINDIEDRSFETRTSAGLTFSF